VGLDTLVGLAEAFGPSADAVDALEVLAKVSRTKLTVTWPDVDPWDQMADAEKANLQPVEETPKLTPLQRLRREAAWCMEEEP
jgi:hypothetical protein